MNSVLTELNTLVNSYEPSKENLNTIDLSKLLVFCGVTASGKNSIADILVNHGNYSLVVSHTTREPRANHGIQETNGKDYWFVSPEQMLGLVKRKEFLEIKAVHGNTFYGTTVGAIRSVIDFGKIPIMEIDVHGAEELFKLLPNLKPLFILPPSYEEWMERLGLRGDISDGEKQRRLKTACDEINTAINNQQFIIIINHQMELTASEIINGVDSSSGTQASNRELAKDLLASVEKF